MREYDNMHKLIEHRQINDYYKAQYNYLELSKSYMILHNVLTKFKHMDFEYFVLEEKKMIATNIF